MKSIDILEKNKSGRISLNKKNVMKIMYLIIVNEITNVYHYLKSELRVNPSVFYEKVKEIKELYPDYYNYYINNLENNIAIRNENLINILLYVGTLFNYGVELNDGTFREFDHFDWLQIKNKYFDNLGRKEISKIIDSLAKDYIIFEANINMFDIRKIISSSYGNAPSRFEYIMHEDEVINDKSYGLTDAEARKLVDFMKKNNIPITYRNYYQGVKKMLAQRNTNNNFLDLNLYIPEKGKTLIRG